MACFAFFCMTGLVLSQELGIKQIRTLSLCLQAGLLQQPVTALDGIIAQVESNPDDFERRLKEKKESEGNLVFSYSALIRELLGSPSGDGGKELSGSPDTGKNLEILSPEDAEFIAPDCTLVVDDDYSCRMVPSETFQPYGLRQQMLPPKTGRFLGWLVNQRNWMVTTLSETYPLLGKHQFEFLLHLDSSRLTTLVWEDLPGVLELPYTMSTYHRLLRNRAVAVKSPAGNLETLPVKYLIVSPDKRLAYNVIPGINSVLSREGQGGKVFSDQTIVDSLKETGFSCVARRTVAKYRAHAGIPNTKERAKAFADGRVKPYRIGTSLEIYLENRSKR